MPIVVHLDVMMARRKVGLSELAASVAMALGSLCIMRSGRARAIRFSTLDALCRALDCQPGDLLTWTDDPEGEAVPQDSE